MYKFKLAIRYFLKRKISYFAVFAITLCVFVVLVVLTVLNGLTSQFKDEIHYSVGDCVIFSDSLVGFPYYQQFIKKLEEIEFVKAAAPVVRTYGLVSIDDNIYTSGQPEETVEILAIEPESFAEVTEFKNWLYYDKDNYQKAFIPAYGPKLPGFVSGINFLFTRDVYGDYKLKPYVPNIRIEITCFPLTPGGAPAKAGLGDINSKYFYFSNCVQSGIALNDWKRIYLPIEQAQALCGMNTPDKRVTSLFIKFQSGEKLESGVQKVNTLWADFVKSKSSSDYYYLLENTKVQSWKSYNRKFIAGVETEQIMMIMIFILIGVITVFIVFVIFYMIVNHKKKDIGILKSFGASVPQILILFLNFAFFIVISGSLIGTFAGYFFLKNINAIENWLFENFGFQLWDRSIYAIGDIPNEIKPAIIAGVILGAVAACLAGACLPALKAARLKPVETLQVIGND